MSLFEVLAIFICLFNTHAQFYICFYLRNIMPNRMNRWMPAMYYGPIIILDYSQTWASEMVLYVGPAFFHIIVDTAMNCPETTSGFAWFGRRKLFMYLLKQSVFESWKSLNIHENETSPGISRNSVSWPWKIDPFRNRRKNLDLISVFWMFLLSF